MKRFFTSAITSVLLAGTLLSLAPIGAPALDILSVQTAEAQTVPTTPEESQKNAQGGGSGTCSWYYPSFETCFWQPLMSWLGSLFLTLGGSFLRLAGALFDTLIRYVIIAYATTLQNLEIMEAINIGWTVFRDFSNILIIGLFVFLAISIILGLKEFGDKRLIANVLIVAVLMNFSLIFTKVIIDGSNFVSFQIYKQMAGASGANATQFDVSQAFLAPMGITSIFNTYPLVRNVAATSGSAMQAFAFGLVGGILLAVVAVVLLYGSFLIAARAVLFILLMLTAPLAFATYLHPSFAKGEYGWESWWKALINNAAFGPLLMIMLAVSLAIIQAAQTVAKEPIGNVIGDPSRLSAASGATILVYIIGIGLLFVSMKLASSFAGSISGYSFAASLPFKLAAGVGAPLMRQTVGRIFAGRADKLAGQAKEDRGMAAKARTSASIHELYGNKALAAQATRRAAELEHSAAEKAIKAAKAAKIGDKKFNLNDSKAIQALGKGLGVSLAGSSKDTKGYSSQIKEAAKHAAEIAEKAGEATRDEISKNRELLSNAAGGTAIPQLVEKKDAHKQSDEVLNTVKEATRAQRELIDDQRKLHSNEIKQARDEQVRLEKMIQTTEANPSKTVDEKIRERASHEEEIAKQSERIKRASIDLESVDRQAAALREKVIDVHTPQGVVRTSQAAAQSQFEKTKRELDNTEKSLKQFGNQAAKIAADTSGNIVENVARHEAGVLGRALGTDDALAKSARDQSRSNKELKNLKKIIESETKKDDHGGGAAPAASTSSGGDSGHH